MRNSLFQSMYLWREVWTSIASLILRNRIGIFILWLIVFFPAIYFARFAEMNLQPGRVLPREDSTWVDYGLFRLRFGEEANVLFLAHEEVGFPLVTGSKWAALADTLRGVEGIEGVLSVYSAEILQRNDSLRQIERVLLFPEGIPEERELLLEKLNGNPMYEGLLWNSERTVFPLLLALNADVIHHLGREVLVSRIIALAEAFTQETGFEVHMSGLPFIRTETIRKSKSEIFLFIVLAGLITAGVLLLFFRSVRAILVPLVVVGTGVLYSTALLYLLGFKITSLTGLLPPLLIVIGVPNAVYMITKYHQEYVRHKNKILALTRVIYRTGKAIFLTNLTTAIGFGTLMITNSSMLVEFGILAMLSVLLLFLLSVTLIPVFFSFLPAPGLRHTGHLDRRVATWLSAWLMRVVSVHRKWVYGVSVFVALFSILGLLQIRPSGMIADDMPRGGRMYNDLVFFEQHFRGVVPLEILIEVGSEHSMKSRLALWRAMVLFQDSLAMFPELGRPVSVVEVVRGANQAFRGGRSVHYALPGAMDLGFLMEYIGSLGGEMQDMGIRLHDKESGTYRIQLRMKDLGSYEMIALQERIMGLADRNLAEVSERVWMSGAGVVMLKATAYLVNNLLISLFLAVVVIALIMSLMFRSFLMVIISLIPNLMPLLFTAGFMGWAGIPLKASTCLIFSVAFGISVDDTIHFLSRYRQELKHTRGRIKDSVYGALGETGLSMTYTSVILFFGFSIFIASDFGSTVALGMLVSITLLVAMFTNLTLLPSLLIGMHPKERDELYETYPNLEDPDNTDPHK
jgi:predicted RND superfamily exporter protein